MKAKHLMALLGAALMAAALTACARESGEVPSAPQAPASATDAGESADGAAPAAEYHKITAEEAKERLDANPDAVIVGTAAEAECDKLCVVTAPFEVSVERIAARDGISPEMAARRLNAQTPEAALTARADYILPNTSTREALAKAANELCDTLIGEGCRT